MLVYVYRFFHEAVCPLHGQQIELFEEVKKLVFRPFRIGEALVLRIGHDQWRSGLPGNTLHRARPQIEVGAAETTLQFNGTLWIGEPVFRHLADGLDDVGDFVSELAFDLAFLARLHVGGERLAAFLYDAGEIPSQRLIIDARKLGRFRIGNGQLDRLHSGDDRLRWFVGRLLHSQSISPCQTNGADRALLQTAVPGTVAFLLSGADYVPVILAV